MEDLLTNVTISKSCETTSGTIKDYWEVVQNKYRIEGLNSSNAEQGLIFITVNEKIASSFLGSYSIIGFYTIIVYAIGTILRGVSFTFYFILHYRSYKDHQTVSLSQTCLTQIAYF